MAYTTASLIEAELRLTTAFSGSTSPTLAQVTTWITEEDSWIDGYVGVSYESTARTDVINYDGCDKLYLKYSPVLSITQLLYSTSSLGTSTYALSETKTEDTDFTVFKDRGEIEILFSNWSPKVGLKRIQVNYLSGYSAVPTQIQLLSTKLVAQRVMSTWMNQVVNEAKAGKSISVGSINISKDSSYGLNQYAKIGTDIDELKKSVISGFRVYRYSNY